MHLCLVRLQDSLPCVFFMMQTSVPLVTKVITKHSYCTKHSISFASPLLSLFSSCLESNYIPNCKGEHVETSLLHPLLGPCFVPGLPAHREELPTDIYRTASLFSSRFSFMAMPLMEVKLLAYDEATAYHVGLWDLFTAHT